MALDLAQFFAASKMLTDPHAGWETREATDRLVWVGTLDVDYVTVEGALLRFDLPRSLEERDITIQLEHKAIASHTKHISRIDWRPIHEHDNKRRGPEEFRLRKISASHVHTFEHNWK